MAQRITISKQKRNNVWIATTTNGQQFFFLSICVLRKLGLTEAMNALYQLKSRTHTQNKQMFMGGCECIYSKWIGRGTEERRNHSANKWNVFNIHLVVISFSFIVCTGTHMLCILKLAQLSHLGICHERGKSIACAHIVRRRSGKLFFFTAAAVLADEWVGTNIVHKLTKQRHGEWRVLCIVESNKKAKTARKSFDDVVHLRYVLCYDIFYINGFHVHVCDESWQCHNSQLDRVRVRVMKSSETNCCIINQKLIKDYRFTICSHCVCSELLPHDFVCLFSSPSTLTLKPKQMRTRHWIETIKYIIWWNKFVGRGRWGRNVVYDDDDRHLKRNLRLYRSILNVLLPSSLIDVSELINPSNA